MIHLGYETGTGRPVSIPLAHMAVTGQTQQSGKTTTLEALIDRGDLRAVVFVTKPGEKSFSEGRRILPFFRERADWEYVKELLESRRNESLSKWDGYLMRVCAKARTLQDVRHHVEKELPKKKSMRPSHYEVLAGYLDLIIPELERVNYTDKLDLKKGVNIMDLTGLSDDMQSMVIRSTIEQIHKHEHNTVLVIPEAWKFIPEGGRSSVYQALHALIREGATNGNYVWIDAQDLAVVSKRILKSVSVWILGKQQEANEVARTINHLIEPLQIRPDMIKSLGIGQFLICADNHAARRIYVQPRWLGELDALAIARGEESVETAQAIFRQKKRELAARPVPRPKDVISEDEQAAVTAPLADNFMSALFGIPDAGRQENADAGRQERAEDVQAEKPARQPATTAAAGDQAPGGRIGTGTANGNVGGAADPGAVGGSVRAGDPEEDETVWQEKYEALQKSFLQLERALARLQDRYETELGKPAPPFDAPANGNGVKLVMGTDLDAIYREMKRRAENDPGILQLLAAKPELRVTIEPKTIQITDGTLRGWLALLISKGFFAEPRNGNTAFNELQRQGRKVAKPNVYRELDTLAEWGFVTKEETGYQSTGLKITVGK